MNFQGMMIVTAFFAAILIGSAAMSVTQAGSLPDDDAAGWHGAAESIAATGCHGAKSTGCHGEKAAAGCHGRTASLARRHASRVAARADRREAARESREDERAARVASRSCHGSGGAAQPSGGPQSSPCDCPPGCDCRR